MNIIITGTKVTAVTYEKLFPKYTDPDHYKVGYDETNGVVTITAYNGGISIPLEYLSIEPAVFYSLQSARVLIRERKRTQHRVLQETNEALRNCVLWIMRQRMLGLTIRPPEVGRDFSNAHLKSAFNFNDPEFTKKTLGWQLSQATGIGMSVCLEVLRCNGYDCDLAYQKLSHSNEPVVVEE